MQILYSIRRIRATAGAADDLAADMDIGDEDSVGACVLVDAYSSDILVGLPLESLDHEDILELLLIPLHIGGCGVLGSRYLV